MQMVQLEILSVQFSSMNWMYFEMDSYVLERVKEKNFFPIYGF